MDITDLDGLLSLIDDIIERYVERTEKKSKEFRVVKVDSKLIKKILEHGLLIPRTPKQFLYLHCIPLDILSVALGGQKLVREVIVLYAKN